MLAGTKTVTLSFIGKVKEESTEGSQVDRDAYLLNVEKRWIGDGRDVDLYDVIGTGGIGTKRFQLRNQIVLFKKYILSSLYSIYNSSPWALMWRLIRPL